ncbi:MAG: PucR family transcriptional regulator [Patulibacter sp.]
MSLTLGELLDQPHLGLELLTARDSARGRTVRGAHAIEVDTPTRWIPHEWLMLTNGLRLRGRADEQRRLVAELAEGGQAGLGWAVGLVLQRVPRAVLDEAERRDFPVVLVPIQTAFHEIISLVHHGRADDDMYVMRRLMAIEDYLMEALSMRHPEQAIVDRLAQTLDLGVAITDAGGVPAQHAGLELPRAVSPAIVARDIAVLEATIDREACVLPIPHEGKHPQLLVAASRHGSSGGGVTDPLARAVLRRAVHLLGLVAGSYRRNAQVAKAQGTEILRRSLRPTGVQQARALDAEAGSLQVPPAEGVELALWRLADHADTAIGTTGEAGLDRIRDLLIQHSVPHLAAELETAFATLQPSGRLPADDELPAWVTRIGVSRTLTSLADAPRALDDACLAFEQLRPLTADGGRIVHFSDLDNLGTLIGQVRDPVELRRAASLLDPLRGHDHLLTTLRSWIVADANNGATALELHLHRNTLRYRLNRIEELLALTLSSPRAITNVQLALVADELLGRASSADAGDDRPE